MEVVQFTSGGWTLNFVWFELSSWRRHRPRFVMFLYVCDIIWNSILNIMKLGILLKEIKKTNNIKSSNFPFIQIYYLCSYHTSQAKLFCKNIVKLNNYWYTPYNNRFLCRKLLNLGPRFLSTLLSSLEIDKIQQNISKL